MLRSTFLGYKTATSALTVSQNMMDVVGQNISNVNTQGYSRQRLDINSVSLSNSNVKFGTTGAVIGQGVGTSGVSQYRDSFLDLRYRTESAKVGSEEVQLEALGDLESIFDEITTDGLDSQFSDLLEQLHSLTSSPSDPVLEGVVRTSAEMLTQIFNNYSNQIDTVKDQQLSYLKDGAVEKTNQILGNIADLNKQIKADNVSGNPALELNDERNTLIDELSNYLDIKVSTEPLEIGGGKTVDELVIRLGNTGLELVNRDKNIELVVGENTTNPYETAIYSETNNDDGTTTQVDISTLISGGQIGGYLKFLNGSGEYASTSYENKGAIYFESMLDTLANKFANIMNDTNKSVDGYDKDLFSARGADATDPSTEIITAGNIKISDNWAKATDSYITNTKTTGVGDNSGATDNILKMISKFQSGEGTFDFKTSGDTGTPIFKGTFQEFLTYTSTRLSLQVSDANTSFDTYSDTQYQIDYARSSISSVDLNEEGVNLLTYSKSYNAAARLMTTLDDMLDTLINEMAR
ncbi:MAG: flagellar hook-associated protein FlgK [Sedimentibacter sp.]